jgi:hypothetical protein
MMIVRSEDKKKMDRKAVTKAAAEANSSGAQAGERSGYAREKPCRQALVILQHKDLRRETSEFRSHGRAHTNFWRRGQ